MLYTHQRTLLDLNPAQHLLAWGTGTGKTRMPLELAEKNCVPSLLIVCPKGLKTNWEREIEKYRYEGRLHSMTIKVISKEEFRRDWKILEKFAAIAIDEGHTFAGMQSQLHKAMVHYLKRHDVQFIWVLTATPFLRNAWNIYALARLLRKGWNYYSFREQFFYERYLGPNKTFWEPLPGKQNEIAALVARLGSTVKLDDCIDIPDAVFENEYFKLTSAQEKAIKAVHDPMPAVRNLRCHQIAGGTLKGNEYEPTKEFACDKVARVLELVEENPKLIIVCRYLAEMEMLQTAILKTMPTGTIIFSINGETKDKQLVLDQFNVSPAGILIVNASCSEGWQAPSAQLMVFYSKSFSYKDFVQMCGRTRRIDHPQKVTYLSLICEKSVDEGVEACLGKKEDFDTAIYDYPLNK